MVQEARYAWDDEENQIGLPDRRDRFNETDDAFLDPYLPKAVGDGEQTERHGRRTGNSEPRNRPDQKTQRQHLSDDGRLNDNPPTNKQKTESE